MYLTLSLVEHRFKNLTHGYLSSLKIRQNKDGLPKILNTTTTTGTSLAIQWLRLCTSTAGVAGSIPGRGTKIPHGVWPKNKTTTTTNEGVYLAKTLLASHLRKQNKTVRRSSKVRGTLVLPSQESLL